MTVCKKGRINYQDRGKISYIEKRNNIYILSDVLTTNEIKTIEQVKHKFKKKHIVPIQWSDIQHMLFSPFNYMHKLVELTEGHCKEGFALPPPNMDYVGVYNNEMNLGKRTLRQLVVEAIQEQELTSYHLKHFLEEEEEQVGDTMTFLCQNFLEMFVHKHHWKDSLSLYSACMPTILGIVPFYTKYGDETLILYGDYTVEVVEKSIYFIVEKWLALYGKSLPLLRKRQGCTGWGDPIIVDDKHILVPIKTRQKRINTDFAYGFYNVKALAKYLVLPSYYSILIGGVRAKQTIGGKERRFYTTYLWMPQGYIELASSLSTVYKKFENAYSLTKNKKEVSIVSYTL